MMEMRRIYIYSNRSYCGATLDRQICVMRAHVARTCALQQLSSAVKSVVVVVQDSTVLGCVNILYFQLDPDTVLYRVSLKYGDYCKVK